MIPVLAHLTSPAEQFGLALALLGAAWFYIRGVSGLWHQAGRGSGIPQWRVWSFFVGLAVIPVALTGPLPPAADRLFSAHMLQHQLLMLAAAPLIVLGKPGLAAIWAVQRRRRRPLVRWRHRLRAGLLVSRPVALVVMVGVTWLWHIPVAYESAVRVPVLHAVEHLTMFGAAVLFWASLGAGRDRQIAGSVLSLFAAGVATSILATLLLFSGRPLYPEYAVIASGLDVSPLADQRLAALIMWIPSGVIGIAVTMVLFTRWLSAIDTEPEISRFSPMRPATPTPNSTPSPVPTAWTSPMPPTTSSPDPGGDPRLVGADS